MFYANSLSSKGSHLWNVVWAFKRVIVDPETLTRRVSAKKPGTRNPSLPTWQETKGSQNFSFIQH